MPLPAFSFDIETHRYTVAGREVPSCTRVLDRSGLVDFRFVREDILERKAELGREVHKACDLWNKRRKFSVDDRVKPYVDAWINFCERANFEPRASEEQQIASVNGMLYGMTLDAEGSLYGEDAIIEIKTGEIFPHHAIQTAGYAAGFFHPKLETPLGRFRTRARYAVQLRKNATPKIVRFEDKSDFDVFTSALFTVYWRMKYEKIYKGAESNVDESSDHEV